MYGAIKNGIIFVSIFILSTCDDKCILRVAITQWIFKSYGDIDKSVCSLDKNINLLYSMLLQIRQKRILHSLLT